MVQENKALSKLLEGSFVILVGNLLGMVSSFGTRVLIGRYLGSSNYGLLVIGLTLVNTSSMVLLFGLPQGLAQKIPRSESRSSIYSAALLVSLPFGFLFACIGVLFSVQIADIFASPNATSIIVAFSISLPFYLFTKISLGLIRGKSDITGRVLLQNIILQLLLVIGVLIAIYYNLQIQTVAQIWAATFVLSSIVAGVYIFKKYKILATSPTINDMYTIAKFSAPLMVSNTLWLMLQQTDNLLLGYFYPSAVVGRYDAAYTIAKLLLVAVGALGFLFLPISSKLDDESQNTELVSIYKRATKFLVFLNIPIMAIYITFPKELLSIIYGPSYMQAQFALVIVSLGFFTHSVLGNNGNALTATGSTRVVAIGSLVGFVLNCILNLILIPLLKENGAAISSAVSYITVNLIYSVMLYRSHQINPISRGVVKSLIAVITIVITFKLSVGDINSSIEFMSITAIELLLIVLSLIIFGLNKSDREFIKSRIPDVTIG